MKQYQKASARKQMSVGGWELVSTAPSNKVEIFDCLSNTWFHAPDHIKLSLPLAYHGMEVIKNKVYTIGGYSSHPTDGTDPGYRGEPQP